MDLKPNQEDKNATLDRGTLDVVSNLTESMSHVFIRKE